MARQIAAVQRLGVDVSTAEINGPPKLKYLTILPTIVKKAKAVDLVHAHFGYSGWVALAQRSRPVVISFMGNDLLGKTIGSGRRSIGSALSIALNQMAARLASSAIVKSAEMASMLEGVDPFVIPNGVDLDAFAPIDREEARRRLGWPTDRLIALFPGNPDFPNKGYSVFAGAAATAADILGQPVETRVLWGIQPDLVPIVMSATDALVLASQTEGSPNVVKEALACELPVVATRVGDVPWLLDGAEGCFLTDREPGPMGRALARALSCGRLNCGRRILRERGLDDASVARRIVAVYDGVLKKVSA
ncbi:MAG TPA: glycosyltransferase [Candidatus Polarisedimenticolaceae bacterium]|nr:glycosyltransferase [Candidatus Polarisedimenticolaceae bacterium]